MSVDTQSTTGKHRLPSVSTSYDPTVDSRLTSVEEAMKDMSKSIRRLSTQLNTSPFQTASPTSVSLADPKNHALQLLMPLPTHKPTTPYIDLTHQPSLPSFTTVHGLSTFATSPKQPATSSFPIVFTPQPNTYTNRLPRVEVPSFSGEGIVSWRFQIERYFDIYNVPSGQKLLLVTFHLTRAALDWYFWMHSTN